MKYETVDKSQTSDHSRRKGSQDHPKEIFDTVYFSKFVATTSCSLYLRTTAIVCTYVTFRLRSPFKATSTLSFEQVAKLSSECSPFTLCFMNLKHFGQLSYAKVDKETKSIFHYGLLNY